jgi:hypothetical protein
MSQRRINNQFPGSTISYLGLLVRHTSQHTMLIKVSTKSKSTPKTEKRQLFVLIWVFISISECLSGLKNGPSVFQRLMDKVPGRFKWQTALVYIDDIIIYSKEVATHIKDIGTILCLVAKSGLTLSLTKCHLVYQSLTALGHTVSNLGSGTAEGTVKASRNSLNRPTSSIFKGSLACAFTIGVSFKDSPRSLLLYIIFSRRIPLTNGTSHASRLSTQ